jgi:pimeloyl-ACP methyl ester carboxylesterase
VNVRRRLIVGAALSGMTVLGGQNAKAYAQAKKAPSRAPLRKLQPLRHVETDVLNIAYYEEGPASGPAVILLHGFPYDIHTYAEVAPVLAAKGCRVIVPCLRGYGETRFRDTATLRSAEQAALGADVIALIDALGIKSAVFAGHNWGGRAATVAAALWPERCAGLVTVNSYLIQDLSRAMVPAAPENEEAMWYEYYFQLERGRAGLAANRRKIARMLWEEWSPDWDFDDATFDRSMPALDNPDFVDVAIHSYRHRFGNAEGDPRYAELAKRLAAMPPITVPAVTLDGDSDGVVGAGDGSASAAKFMARRIHRVVKGAGHNVPQEAPEVFAAAVMELVKA